MALNPGDTLLNGQYCILGLQGRGGYGFVYQAQDTLLGELVAIKELIPALVGDEASLKRFLAEAKATMRLAHKCIVRTHNVFSEGGNYYIVMEYMPGGSLEALLEERGDLPVAEAVRIAVQVCEGLAGAHEEGVVHCDLKPANILFAAGEAQSGIGSAKVADFGIAHVSAEMLTRSWMTPAGFTAGTLPYMSPEQTDGVRDDPRVDVYALGAVLYRMLTDQTYLAFDSWETPRGQAKNVERIYREEPDPPSIHNRQVPAWLDAVVLRALAKQPEARYASAAELEAALVQGEEGPTAVWQGQPALGQGPPPHSPSARRPARRRSGLPAWFWIMAGITAALLVVVVIAVVLLLADGGGGTASVSTSTLTATPTPTLVPSDTATPTRPPTQTPTHIPAPTATPVPPTPTSPETEATALPSPTVLDTPSPLPPSSSPVTLPQGEIAFTSQRDGNTEIYVMKASGGGVTRLTNNPAEDWFPIWSPDGTRIAFSTQRDRNWEVYVMNADGSGLMNLTNHTAFDRFSSWSPDARQIAFTSSRDGNREIYVMNANGSGQARLTDNPVHDRAPAWSPDGIRVAFVMTHADGNDEVYVMNVDGTGVRNLTGHAAKDYRPAWAPDGERIVFTSERDGNLEIYALDVDSGRTVRLTDHPASDSEPSWSPDGRYIVFVSDRDGNKEIYLMNSDGSGTKRLTDEPAIDEDPAWRP